MQNIQDLKEKIFFESKNIIDILDKINNVDELLSKQDLVDELANRISFLKLLERNIEYFIPENTDQSFDNQEENSFIHEEGENQELGNEVIEEEAIFNNELNEIDENETEFDFQEETEIPIHENIQEADPEPVIIAGENAEEENISPETIEEEVLFTNQLNEINEFENEISEDEEFVMNSFDEQDIEETPEPITEFKIEISEEESTAVMGEDEILEEEFLIEESEEQFISPKINMEQGEMVTETSSVESLISEIKDEAQTEEKQEEVSLTEEREKRKIVEIENLHEPVERERPASEEEFEEQDLYHHEKRIKLSNIKGLKNIQTLFDDDPLERESSTSPSNQEDPGSLLKTNVPTNLMEAEKAKPAFKLDLNDRIAFSKMLFGGSQSELNDVVAELNSFKNLEDAKEYLSELYYAKNWKKADEYAQRLWLLVENKFL
ncbi:hypothetical protein [Chryseobacterium sp. CT-SW4]|uniref:hypothetical protein n=1 Tax=Chryseobacterium sp. SW-1 TaxID=3157343 RepID=UPI003B027BE4